MIQTLLRSIKKYSHIETKSNELLDFSWTSSTLLILEVIKNGSQDIIQTVYKALEDILIQSNCVSLFMNNISTSFKIFEATADWLENSKQDPISKSKPINLKLCPVIIETLKRVYCKDNLEENNMRAPYLQIIIPNYIQVLLHLLLKMMRNRLGSSREITCTCL